MIEVHIDDRFEVNGLDIYLWESVGGYGMKVWEPNATTNDHGVVMTGIFSSRVIPGDQLGGRIQDKVIPFHIPREAAGPLFNALGRLLGNVENPLQLREDYMAERKRVDKFIDAAILGMPVVRNVERVR